MNCVLPDDVAESALADFDSIRNKFRKSSSASRPASRKAKFDNDNERGITVGRYLYSAGIRRGCAAAAKSRFDVLRMSADPDRSL